MKRNWTFAAIALLLSLAAVAVAFIAGKKFTEDPDLDQDEDQDEETEKPDQDGKE